MAKQIKAPQQGGLLGKVADRLKGAHEEHKDDPTEYSKFGELPGGIEGGVARLVEAKFGLYKEGKNKDEPFFYAAGVVVSPTEHFDRTSGIIHPIEGLRTSLTIPMCDTVTSNNEIIPVSEHYARLLNELRKLQVDTANMPFEQLEQTVAALAEIQPHFKFRTWSFPKREPGDPRYKEQYDGPNAPPPRVNHDWQGVVTFHSNGDTNAVSGPATEPPAQPSQQQPAKAVQPAAAAPARTPPQVASKPNGVKPPQSPPAPPVTTATRAAPVPPPQPEPEQPAFDEFGDVDGLVSLAEQGDEVAQQQLTTMAANAGLAAEAEQAEDWPSVGKLLTDAGIGGGAGDEEPGEWQPNAGEVYGYRPVDPKSKKPAATQAPVEITEVDVVKQTVTARHTKNKKLTYKGVPWAALESLEG